MNKIRDFENENNKRLEVVKPYHKETLGLHVGRLNLKKTFRYSLGKVRETWGTISKMKECNNIVGIRKLIEFLALLKKKDEYYIKV